MPRSATHTSYRVSGHEYQVVPWPPIDRGTAAAFGIALLVMMGVAFLFRFQSGS